MRPREFGCGGPIKLEQLPEDEAAIAISMMGADEQRRQEELVKNVNTITKNAKAAAAESPQLAMQMFRAAKLLAPLRASESNVAMATSSLGYLMWEQRQFSDAVPNLFQAEGGFRKYTEMRWHELTALRYGIKSLYIWLSV